VKAVIEACSNDNKGKQVSVDCSVNMQVSRESARSNAGQTF
jgi:hypothetical protein